MPFEPQVGVYLQLLGADCTPFRCECGLNSSLAPWICTMLEILTKKLRNQSLNEIPPFQLKISYTPSDEEDSDDSEGENQELAQIDREDAV